MKYRLKVYSIWECGQRKDSEGNPHQEDCTFPLPKDLKDSDRTFILCDGMGGHDAGEVASATVCETMGNSILRDGHDGEGVFADDDLMNAIADAFSALDKKDSGAEKKMGTTMTFLKLHDNGATIAHMGDSRVYQIRPGDNGDDTRILFETEDHSLVNDLIRIGELTKEEARTSKQKNVITRAMQPNMERKPKPDIKHITDIKAGDFFYMCSDGMLEQEDMANGESLKNIFSNIVKSDEDRVNILTGATKHNRDNHTALIIHVEDVEGGIADKKESKEEKKTAVPEYDMAVVEDASSENTSSPDRKIRLPKSKTGLLRLILCGMAAAIAVAACIVAINYIPSCSGEEVPEKVNPSAKKQNSPVRGNAGKRKARVREHSQAEPQRQEQVQSVVLDAVNSDAAQTVAEENALPQTVANINASTNAIQFPADEGVVSHDNQIVREVLDK